MSTSQSRPFSAATSKLAYAQAFAGPSARRRHDATSSSPRVGRRLLSLRPRRRG
jgi:hypothetical protein